MSSGLTSAIEEFKMDALRAELEERERRKKAGVCTFCKRDYWSSPVCHFPKRHQGKEF